MGDIFSIPSTSRPDPAIQIPCPTPTCPTPTCPDPVCPTPTCPDPVCPKCPDPVCPVQTPCAECPVQKPCAECPSGLKTDINKVKPFEEYIKQLMPPDTPGTKHECIASTENNFYVVKCDGFTWGNDTFFNANKRSLTDGMYCERVGLSSTNYSINCAFTPEAVNNILNKK